MFWGACETQVLTYSTWSGGFLKHRYLQYMFWMTLPTQLLIENVLEDYWIVAAEILTLKCTTVHVMGDSRNRGIYSTFRLGFLQHRYLQYMTWRIINTGTYSTWPGDFLQHRYLQYMTWGILEHRYSQYMTWRILATQVLTVHILEKSYNTGSHCTVPDLGDSRNTGTYSTSPIGFLHTSTYSACPGGFLHHRNLQVMSWRILATQVLTVHVLEDSCNTCTYSTCPGECL